jgi:hypothetical protein
MPKPVPIAVRRESLQRAHQGESTARLAAAFGIPLAPYGICGNDPATEDLTP